jgi:hypothetical protein
VEEWLATDPSLTAELAALQEPPSAAAISGRRLLDADRAVIDRTRGLLRQRAWWLSVAVLCTGLVVMSVYHRVSGMHFFLQRFAALEYGTMLAGVACWTMFYRSVRRLRVVGL